MDRFTLEWPPVQGSQRPTECPRCLEPIAEHEHQIMDGDTLMHADCWRRDQEEEPEPGCTCSQTDVDLFDARGCELHDQRSSWNYRQERLRLLAK